MKKTWIRYDWQPMTKKEIRQSIEQQIIAKERELQALRERLDDLED